MFTPQFAAVFGGPNGDRYEEFCQVCCDAYNCLRKENQLIVSLFRLMISSGLPEVSDGFGGGTVKVVCMEKRADQVGCFVVVVFVFLQLQTEADLIWLREKLCIGKTNEEASLHFRAKIKESLTCERTMLNNFFHIMKHR